MFTAKQLREENIAEYLLYMWQLEDIFRACRFDIETVRQRIVDNYPTDEDTKAAMLPDGHDAHRGGERERAYPNQQERRDTADRFAPDAA